MFPDPVAATTIPSAPAATAASSKVPSIPMPAMTRWTRGDAGAAPATCRRTPLPRSIRTRPSSTWPNEPTLGLLNVVNAVAWVLLTSSAGSIVPASVTTTPTSRALGAAATATASRRLAGPS